MLKNITLSAEKDLIEKARRQAEARNTTLNNEFRLWLAQYVEAPRNLDELNELMKGFTYVRAGRKFDREDMNERR